MTITKERCITTATITTRYAESDQMGFIHHANHIIWFEVARMQLFREYGIDLNALEAEGIIFPVLSVEAHYHAPTYYDNEVQVRACIASTTHVKLFIQYEVVHNTGTILCSGTSAHAFVEKKTLKPVPIAKWIKEKIAAVMP